MFPEEEESGLLILHPRRHLLRAGVEPVAVRPAGHQPQAVGRGPAQCRAPRLSQTRPVKGFPSVCWVWIFFSQKWTIWVKWAASPLGGHLLGDPGVWLRGHTAGGGWESGQHPGHPVPLSSEGSAQDARGLKSPRQNPQRWAWCPGQGQGGLQVVGVTRASVFWLRTPAVATRDPGLS